MGERDTEIDVQTALTVIGRRAAVAQDSAFRVDLGETKLRRAHLANVRLSSKGSTPSSLRKTVLDGAFLLGADLRKSIMTGATFVDADLRQADLRGTIELSVEELYVAGIDVRFEHDRYAMQGAANTGLLALSSPLSISS